MRADIILADSVQAADGKLHALGIGWRVLTVAGLPARHDRIGLGLVLRLEPPDPARQTLAVRLRGPDGRDRTLGSGADGNELRAIQIPFEARGTGERTVTIALNLDGLVFDAEGAHTLGVEVGGLALGEATFLVQRGSTPPPSDRPTGVYL